MSPPNLEGVGRPGTAARWLVATGVLAALCVASLHADDDVARCQRDPTLLRETHIYREVGRAAPETRGGLMREIALDAQLPWDVRARAVTLLDPRHDDEVMPAFAAAFSQGVAAGGEEVAAAIGFLAEWLRRSGTRGAPIETLLIPDDGDKGVAVVLRALVGQPAHGYLRLLHERQIAIDSALIPELAATDDQDTRRFLCWYVGHRHLVDLEPFLVAQIGSHRASTYPSQAQRMFEAMFTAGLSEVIRSAAPLPEWLAEDASPRGMALRSLARLLPEGQRISDRGQVAALLDAAERASAAKDRAEWTLAGQVLLFLHARGEPLAGRGERVLAGVARQVLRRRGPIEAFVLGDQIHRRTGLAMPELSEEEHARIWGITLKTLNSDFLAAVSRSLPDPERRRELEDHLVGLGDQAARGTLRVVRTWGADIEGPGEWALSVAELNIDEAIADVEGVLDTSWPEEAVQALVRYGARGAPALGRFLRTESARHLDREELTAAVRACLTHLPPEQVHDLLDHLLGNSHSRDVVEEVTGEGGS